MKKIILLLLATIAGLFSLHAQTYPVQISTYVAAPASAVLGSYYNGTDVRLQVTINLTDMSRATTMVRLMMKVSSSAVTLQSKPMAYTTIHDLTPGMPITLQQGELAEYFDPRNLDIPYQVAQTGKLPDGTYRFCFWVVDAYTGQVLSNPNISCNIAQISNGKPPKLFLPKNDERMPFKEPVNITFQWQPQSFHIPLHYLEYEFILKELWDSERSPEAGFNTSPVFYSEVVTSNTMLHYGADKPMLTPGKRYAWCVQAKPAFGYEEIVTFNNNGYSEIFSFVFQNNCFAPTGCRTQIMNTRTAQISWEPAGYGGRYIVEYAEKGQSKWYTKEMTEIGRAHV